MKAEQPEPGRRKSRWIYTENWQRFVPKIAAVTPPPRRGFVPPADPPPTDEK
jgi:hypothetical protein